MKSAEEIIGQLKLEPLPIEGGWFRQNYRQSCSEDPPKASATAIYFLLKTRQATKLHRLNSDELFHAYAGDPVELLIVEKDKQPTFKILGNPLIHPEAEPQVLVPAHAWQSARLLPGDHGFSLLGTTMTPGFDWSRFQEGHTADLKSKFPDLSHKIHCYE